ncbi:hypothetical protein HNW77_11825 [Komagataeibacter sp. AV436]|uniref:Uncharacterized protein n=1 Tax=Komagataeibacter melomenusus TaxID=2766578 RepID=A0ABX2AFP4_9PROT|nr:hypothetical protein [Komagataeibacter melomenusus]MBV1831326.1 hypothetical protein [Komagataeibacter melomenusus]NPC67066.1 hypothetical protein [Komagataeibacter melomenusus]
MLPSHKKYLAGLCGCIQDKHPDVPYGLDPNGISFNEDGSINIISDSGTGLTCATFILTLLKCYGFLLLDEKTWPTQKDEKTQRTIIIGLQRIPPQATQEKIVQNTNCIGMRFFYPNEVVGASLCNEKEWPVAYERAEELARIVNTYTDSEVLAIPKS